MTQDPIPVPALREALTRPPDGSDMKITVVTLTPTDCEQIIDITGFQRQRPLRRQHVGTLADAMSNDEFIEGCLITFAPEEDGHMVLIDAQHRLQAAVDSDWTGIWTVRTLWGDKHTARNS